MRLRLAFAALALLALCAAAGERRVTATVTLVDAFGSPVTRPVSIGDDGGLGPPTAEGIVKIAISPAPWVMPHVSASSDNPSAVRVMPRAGSFFTPDNPPGGALLFYGGPGRATITLSVGPPYDVTFRFAATTRTASLVACNGLAVDADGTVRSVRTRAEADVYGTVRNAERCPAEFVDPAQQAPFVMHFPYGAVEVEPPTAPFASIRAAQWRAAVSDNGAQRRSYATWLVRAKSGATIKYRAGWPLEIARAGHEFAPPPASPNPVAHAEVVIPDAPPRFSVAIAVTHILTVVQAAAYDPNVPLLVGPGPRFAGTGYSATDLHVVPLVTPQPYALAPAWTTTGPIRTKTFADGSATIEAQAAGTGTITATVHGASATRRVLSYPVLSVGCGSSALRGVAFGDDGRLIPVDAPDKADLYGSFERGSFACPSPVPRPSEPPADERTGTPYPTTGAWYFPHGGVFFPDGDDPQRTPPAGSPRGVPYTRVTAALWRNDRTAEPHLRWYADAQPCEHVVRNIASIVHGCTTLPDDVLLIRTRTGRLVKILAYGESPAWIEGFYQVSRADGTFAY